MRPAVWSSVLGVGLGLLVLIGGWAVTWPVAEAQESKTVKKPLSAADKKTATKKKKPLANTQNLDVRADQIEESFTKEAQGLAEEYFEAGHLDKAKVLLESVLALRPNADEIKAKLKAIDETILSTNETVVDVNPAKAWEPSKVSVFEGKPFRAQVEGSYRFAINTAVDAAGFPTADPKTDMVGDIPCGALMGIIVKADGKPGRPFAIGNGKDITPKETGLLLLRINSPLENKHTGKISVTFSGFVKAS